MKNIIIIFLFVLIGSILLFACTTSKKQILYNTYLVKHRKYNMEQIFSYPSDVNFWDAQDSATYQIIDTVKYKIKYNDL